MQYLFLSSVINSTIFTRAPAGSLGTQGLMMGSLCDKELQCRPCRWYHWHHNFTIWQQRGWLDLTNYELPPVSHFSLSVNDRQPYFTRRKHIVKVTSRTQIYI